MNTQTTGAIAVNTNGFIVKAYGWLSLGLFISFGLAFLLAFMFDRNPIAIAPFLLSLPIVFIVELILVFVLSAFYRKLSFFLASLMFFAYSVINGAFLGLLMIQYNLQSILFALLATFLTFAVMAIFGYVTKMDLTKYTGILFFGLVAVLIGTIINILVSFANPALADGLFWVLTYVGLGIFVILVAVDTQKLKLMASEAAATGSNANTYAVRGALMLYLDFINLFIRILAIMGKRR